MRDAKSLAIDTVKVISRKLVSRGVGNGVDNDVQAVPVLAQRLEYRVDLLVAADIAGQGER